MAFSFLIDRYHHRSPLRRRSRSNSPSPRSRFDHRDERKHIDSKRGIKQDPDHEWDNYKRESVKYSNSGGIDSKDQLSVTAQAFFKKERERKEMASNGSNNITNKPFNTFGNSSGGSHSKITATVTSLTASPSPSFPINKPYYNRFSNGTNINVPIKREQPKSSVTRPHPSMRNRFDAGASDAELADFDRKSFSDEEVDEGARSIRNMLGIIPSERAEMIEASNKEIKVYEQISKDLEKKRVGQAMDGLFAEYDVNDDEEYKKKNTRAASTTTTTTTDPRLNNSSGRNSSSGSIVESDRNERVNPIRPIHSRFDNVPNVYDSPNSNRFENRSNHSNRSTTMSDDSPQSPDQITSTNTAPVSAAALPKPQSQPQREERIALSDKYVRRPRNSSASGPTTPDLNSPPHIDTGAAASTVTPLQDPRLRNRPSNITSTSNTNLGEPPFLPPYRNQQMPLGPNALNRGFIQDAYHPATPPSLQQHQQQYPPGNDMPFHPQPGRPSPAHHMPHHPVNHGFNAGFSGGNAGGNLPPSHPNNPFRPPNMPPYPNMDPRHSRQSQNQHNLQKETYREHRIRRQMEEKRRAEEEAAAAAAAAAVTSSTAATSDKVDEQQSNSDAPNKDTTKEGNTTEKTVFDKAFRANNWDALSPPLNKSSGNSFKIPKLNKSNSENNKSNDKSTPATTQNSDRNSPIEMNVTTSTGKDTTSDKSKKSSNDSAKRKDSTTKKSLDKKNRNSLDETSQDAVIVADTTIDVDVDQMHEQKSKEKSTSPTQQPTEAAQPALDDLLEQLKTALPQDQLQKVLSIINPENTNANENTVTSSTVPAIQNSNTEGETVKKMALTARKSLASKGSQKAAPVAATAPKPKKQKHANELDRLTADIRENIPGVLDAIGPRACTLNAAKIIDTSPRKAGGTTAAKGITNRRASSGHKSDDDTSSEIGKSKFSCLNMFFSEKNSK